MSPAVIRRFIFLMAVLTIGMFIFWDVLESFVHREPGDYYTETGANRLVDGLYDEAMESFDKALEEAPDHRGALMGRALVFIQTDQTDEALAELDYLIAYLDESLEPDDATGLGALAAAYANRGIVHDRRGAYREALEDYVRALRTDEDSVSGPGVVNKILYGSDGISSVRKRAEYLAEQLKLPEEERLLRLPELDDKQRMHKP